MTATDADYLAALSELSRPFGWSQRERSTLSVVGGRDHQVDVELISDGYAARWWLALPSSGRPMPWVRFHSADDPEGWLDDLRTWLNEEFDTCGVGPNAARVLDDDGVVRVVTEGYGFRYADQMEHIRLRSVVGPQGWSGGHPWASVRRRLAYACEWALDTVERSGATTLTPWRRDHDLERSPDGTRCRVEVGAVGDDLEFVARARRWGRSAAALRRFERARSGHATIAP